MSWLSWFMMKKIALKTAKNLETLLKKAKYGKNGEHRRDAIWTIQSIVLEATIKNTMVKFLINILLNDNDPRVRKAAAACLVRIQAPEALDVFAQILLRDEDPHVREYAAKGLKKGNTEATEPLIEALKHDKNKNIRAQAARTLGEIGDGRAVKALFGVIDNNNEHEEVRDAALTAVIKLQNKEKDLHKAFEPYTDRI